METVTNTIQTEIVKMTQIIVDYSIIANNKGQIIQVGTPTQQSLSTALIAYFTYRILTDKNKNNARIFCSSLYFLSEEQDKKSQALLNIIALTGIKRSHIPLNRQINTLRIINNYLFENKINDPLFPFIVGATLALPCLSQNLLRNLKNLADTYITGNPEKIEEATKKLILSQYTKKLNPRISEHRIKEVIQPYKWKWAKNIVQVTNLRVNLSINSR